MKVVPASLSADEIKNINIEKLEGVLLNLLGRADVIIVDAAAGLGKEALTAMRLADELIVVTNPDVPSVTDALKTIKVAEENGVNVLGVVVNRFKGKKHEIPLSEIKAMLGAPILSVVPEDSSVPKSIKNRKPVVHHRPNSRASIAFKKLASKITGEPFIEEIRKEKSWFERLVFWLR